jgi:hypothetical protein
MGKQHFEERVANLRQMADGVRAGDRKRRTRRLLAERIREERQAIQMLGLRAFKKKRPPPKHLFVRELPKRVVIRRKVIQQ